MNNKSLSLLLFLVNPTMSFADCHPATSDCINTTLGPLEQRTRYHSDDGYSHLTLNGKEIYKAKDDYIVIDTENADYIVKEKKYLISKATISYVSDDPCYPDKPGSRCAMNVILDLTSGKPLISNWFSSGHAGGSQITWVSWGKANSIIVIDNELRFKYSNGHVERVNQGQNYAGDNNERKQ
ncbi:hypothetical protein AB1E22_02035 [Buttiauxella gaviniae]|uniref:Lipoprotein n=1 Tax=Buttiauxella gaviniae TaxID=82990 RepID=A0ABV3NPP7_9ENTR